MTKFVQIYDTIVNKSSFFLILIIILFSVSSYAEPLGVRVTGIVRDSLTHDPIPYAAVLLKGPEIGGLTDEKGNFKIYTTHPFTHYYVTSLGYSPKMVPFSPSEDKSVIIELNPEGLTLNEVVVRKAEEHYTKRNPAVELMRSIRNGDDSLNPLNAPYYTYNKYERIRLGMNDFHADEHQGMLSKFPFLTEYVDTSAITGKPILNLSTREKLSTMYSRYRPKSNKERIHALRNAGIDDVADTESMRKFFEDIMREVDIYQNDIPLMQNRFVSPLSRVAPDFYKFYLTDTTVVDNDSCIVLSFVPHNTATFGFTGRLYVVMNDSSMFVKRISMRVPSNINLNYIKTLRINQTFTKSPEGKRLKMSDDLAIEAQVIPGTPQLYSERHTVYHNHSFKQPSDNDIYDIAGETIIDTEAEKRDSLYWDTKRPESITTAQDGMTQLMARLRKNKLYYWGEKFVKLLANGYVPTGKKSKFDIGPLNTTISYNELEGTRFRFGGMTTSNLNPHWFFKAYGAYGLKDHKWKYRGDVEYSFSPKKYHAYEFPVHSIAATYLYDIDKLGQKYMFTNPDNVFLSLTRHPDRQITYHRVGELRYTLELANNFSLSVKSKYERQEASEYMPFIDGYGNQYSHYNETTFQIQLRYAPGETFYQGRSFRFPINMDAPIFTLSHTFGPAHLLGSKFTINRTEASIIKRFWFSAWGYTDIYLKGGHIWSQTPYPQLLIPNANLSYTIQPESFSLMNAMEFVNDSYASWDITYWANGAIFNYIPLFKKLKLREAFTFRGLWGHLSKKNNPEYNPGLFRFPSIANTRQMSNTPYMEVAVGLDNILTVLRVDYVWRLTYRDTPGASKSGIQIALHFTF